MNKYNFSEAAAGGINTTYNDFEFEQLAIRDGFAGIGLGISNEQSGVILVGCEFTNPIGGGVQVTDGYVLIDGEICKHDLFVYPDYEDAGADGLKFDIVETYDPTGNKNTLIPTTVDTRIIRKAVLNGYYGSEPSNSVKQLSKVMLDKLLTNTEFSNTVWPVLKAGYGAWANATIAAPWANASGQTSRFRLTRDGYLECYFFIKKTSAGSDTMTTFVNPAYQPNKKHHFLAMNFTGAEVIGFSINTDGSILHDSGTLGIGYEYQGYFKIPLVI